MRVCSSTNATTVRRFCGQSRGTAACSVLSAPWPVRRSNNGLIAAHDTTGGAGYPLIGLVTSEGVRFDRGDGCTQSGMNDPPLTSTTMPVRNAAVSDARNATTSATSRGVPSRPTVALERARAARCSSWSGPVQRRRRFRGGADPRSRRRRRHRAVDAPGTGQRTCSAAVLKMH